MKGNRWDDHYARRARDEKWRARSVYKLREIDRKHAVIRRGMRVLDLGCCPGSWSQYGIEKVGAGGNVIGIDLTRPDHLASPVFSFIQGDVLACDAEWFISRVGPRDAVMSDMAPRTTGVTTTDTARSLALAEKAALIARTVLTKRGNFLCKVFDGEDVKRFVSTLSLEYDDIRIVRPQATRKRSREIFVVGLRFSGRMEPPTVHH